MCAVLCHRATQTEPIWLILVGPARTGKTEVITAFKDLPEAYSASSLSPKAFLSGYRDGVGLLERLEASHKHLLLLKDLTTLLSQRQQDQAEVMAALREIADGYYNVDTGKGACKPWEGKLTVLAASTPEVHRAWGGFTRLGPRFMTMNWRSGGAEMGRRAARQVGIEQGTRQLTRQLVAAVMVQPLTLPSLTDAEIDKAVDWATFAAKMRQNVVRDQNQRVFDVDPPEGNPVLSKTFTLILRARAAIYSRTELDAGDWSLVERLMYDSCPPSRIRILEHLADGVLTQQELRHKLHLSESTFRRRLEDMTEIGLVEKETVEGAHLVELTKEGREHLALLGGAVLSAYERRTQGEGLAVLNAT